MKHGRLNHIGIATPSIEESLRYYRDVMSAAVAAKIIFRQDFAEAIQALRQAAREPVEEA